MGSRQVVAIRRFFAKELIGFDNVELEFENGLTVFTGPSGSGKSVLMEGILSVFGYKEPKAVSAEAQIDVFVPLLEEMGIENEEPNVFRYLRKEKARYFVNAQAAAKKDISGAAKGFSFYLSSKDDGDFTDERLLEVLDSCIPDGEFAALKEEYKAAFLRLTELKKEYARLRERSVKAAEEKEFLEFELKKFREIDPKEGEEDELLALKKELSKKEKIAAVVSRVESFLSYKQAVSELYEFLDKDDSALESFFAETAEALGEVDFRLSRLGGIDIDSVFERLEKLSYLNKRYGGISEAIEYFEAKKEELKELEEIDSRIGSLELDIKAVSKDVDALALYITQVRQKAVAPFFEKLSFFTKKLLIGEPKIELTKKEKSVSGEDGVDISLGGSKVSTLSAGEYRRLRLAVMACQNGQNSERAVLFLDEADANLSGEESAGVAFLLRELSKNYQIFAISHQPQLASAANHHFVVGKNEDGSFVRKISDEERVFEIARMVSSGEIKKEALEYARGMLKEGAEC